MTFFYLALETGLLLTVWPVVASAQSLPGAVAPSNSRVELSTPVAAMSVRLTSLSAVTGYERSLVDTLLRLLPGAARDRAGNLLLALGAGSPKRLVLCPLDEPGYVVGNVREDGYLTLRRVSGPVSRLFDQQLEGHRVTIQGSRGPVPGVVAVRSIHLTRGRASASEEPFSADDAYVDVGAGSRREVGDLGVAVLAPVTLTKRPQEYGTGLLAAPVAGRRAACAALLVVAQQRAGLARLPGPVTIAFVVEQELNQRGLATLANAAGPFVQTLIVDGRPGARGTIEQRADSAASLRWPGLGKVTQWSLPVSYIGTAVETVALADADSLELRLLEWIRRGS